MVLDAKVHGKWVMVQANQNLKQEQVGIQATETVTTPCRLHGNQDGDHA